MKITLPLLIILLFSIPALAFDDDPTLEIEKDAYGHGIHSDQYGRPVKAVPAWGSPNEDLDIKKDAYGHGVHSDQYGRPVKIVPMK